MAQPVVVRKILVLTAAILAFGGLAFVAGASRLPAAAAVAFTTPSASSKTSTKLKITVRGLPHDTVVHARLKRHGHSRKVLLPASIKHLKPGHYRLVVKAAKHGHSRYYPKHHRYRVHVIAHELTRLKVKFTIIVPTTTDVVAGKQVSHLISTHHNVTKIVLVSPADTPEVGATVVVGIGPLTPAGLLGRVTSVHGNRVALKPGRLTDAIKKGAFHETFELTPDKGASASGSGWRADPARAGSFVHDLAKHVHCEAGGSYELSGSISVDPAVEVSAKWGLYQLKSAKFVGTVTESAQLQASIAGSASCSLKDAPLFQHSLMLDPVEFTVGPVPVVLVPELQFYLNASGDVQASVTTGYQQQTTVSAGVTWSKADGVSPVAHLSKSQSAQAPTLTSSATLRASVTPTLDLLFYGIAGPSMNVELGLKLDANPSDDPWWTVRAYVTAGAALKIPALHINKRLDGIYDKSWILAQAPKKLQPAIDVSPQSTNPWAPSSTCAASVNMFQINGLGFAPNSSVELTTDWASYGAVTTDSTGSFTVQEPIGEFADADFTDLGVYASGTGGTAATTEIELNSDICHQVTESNGVITMTWGINGFTANSNVDLLINDEVADSAETDDYGSGGSVATFDCPVEGSYTFDVAGIDNGHREHLKVGPLTLTCQPAGAPPNVKKEQRQQQAAVSSAAGD